MFTRRRFLGYTALTPAMLAYRPLLGSGFAQNPSNSSSAAIRLAVIGTSYHDGSAMQTIADRFLVGYPHEGDWHMPNVKIVSMYLDRIPHGGEGVHGVVDPTPQDTADLSQGRAKEFGFQVYNNIPEALRCGGTKLAVDAVVCILEQGDYERNHRQQILYPRFDFFQQCVQVFTEEERSVPYYNYGSLSFSFPEAQSMVATAEKMKFPLLAGSWMPVTYRIPDTDIPAGAQIEEAVMVGLGSLDGMDFDAIEAMQCMLERRKGCETGVKAVQLLEGDDVWAAGASGRWSKEVLSSALSRSDAIQGLTVMDGRPQDLVADGVLPQLVTNPTAYCIEYNDGTRATLLMLNGANRDFVFSAKLAGGDLIATQFFRSPTPNVTYSACLAARIEKMMVTRNAPYPARRTLLTSGILEACLKSREHLNQRMETPHLNITYQAPAESQYTRA
jgi:hypothetical protein